LISARIPRLEKKTQNDLVSVPVGESSCQIAEDDDILL